MPSYRTILCPTCRGQGHTMSPRTRDEHGSPTLCHTCKGDRVVEEVITVEHRRVYNHQLVDNLKKKGN